MSKAPEAARSLCLGCGAPRVPLSAAELATPANDRRHAACCPACWPGHPLHPDVRQDRDLRSAAQASHAARREALFARLRGEHGGRRPGTGRRPVAVAASAGDEEADDLATLGPTLAEVYLDGPLEEAHDVPGRCERCAGPCDPCSDRAQRSVGGLTDEDVLWSARGVLCDACHGAFAGELAERSRRNAEAAARIEAERAARESEEKRWVDEATRAAIGVALAEGATVRSLAVALGISHSTIERYRIHGAPVAVNRGAQPTFTLATPWARAVSRAVGERNKADRDRGLAAVARCLESLGRSAVKVTEDVMRADIRAHQIEEYAAAQEAGAANIIHDRRLSLADEEEPAEEPGDVGPDRPLRMGGGA